MFSNNMKKILRIIPISSILFSAVAYSQSVSDLLDSLNQDSKNWVSSTCPRSLGPSLYSNCVRRNANAIRAGIPTTSGLSQRDANWVSSTCPRSLGPSLYANCVRRNVNAIQAGIPTTSGLSREDADWIISTCPRSLGPSLYSNCVRRNISALRGL